MSKKNDGALDELINAIAPLVKDNKTAVALALAGYFMEVPDNVQRAVLGYVGGETLQRLLEESKANDEEDENDD